MPGPTIVIAGAGIAGLTVGRCLLSRGIRTLVLEKAQSSAKRHDYSIELHSWAYKPLLDILGVEEGAFRKLLSVDRHLSTANDSFKPSLSSCGKESQGSFRCHRGKLEALLSKGLNIEWDKTITNVVQTPQEIDVFIEGKSSVKTTMLIATDGVHSTVRKSILPEARLKTYPYVAFYGTRVVSRETYTRLISPSMQNETSIDLRQDDALLRITINNTTSTHINLGYTYSRPADLEAPSDPLFKPDRPAAGARDIPETLYTELGHLRDLEPAYAEIFDPRKVGQDRVLHWLMRSVALGYSDIGTLADNGIVIIGDAVHAMPILGGYGANIAIQDGVELAKWIAENGTANAGTFVERRYQGWRDSVEQGVRKLEVMHVGGRAAL